MNRFLELLAAHAHEPWAMLAEAFQEMKAKAAERNDVGASAKSMMALPGTAVRVDKIAIIPIQGTIFPKANDMTAYYGLVTADVLRREVQAAANDPSIEAIILDVDSPGGVVTGVSEAAQAIHEAAQQKPVVAVVTGMAASAAYHLASQASEILVLGSGMAGSIGVFIAHWDMSKALERYGEKVTFVHAGKFKVDGNPFEPLSETARADMQQKVNAIYESFVADVARGRKRSVADVKANFGEGRVLLAKDAVAAGMADYIGTMGQAVSRLLRSQKGGSIGVRAFTTVREFEAFLRDEGRCSAAEAKRIAAAGYKASDPRDGERAETSGEMDADAMAAARDFIASCPQP